MSVIVCYFGNGLELMLRVRFLKGQVVWTIGNDQRPWPEIVLEINSIIQEKSTHVEL